jgi:hypothetical protein
VKEASTVRRPPLEFELMNSINESMLVRCFCGVASLRRVAAKTMQAKGIYHFRE